MLGNISTLAAFLTAALFTDGALTFTILRRGGRELNPIMSFFIAKLGISNAVLLSRGFGVGLTTLFWLANESSFLVGLLLPTAIFVAFNTYSVLSNS